MNFNFYKNKRVFITGHTGFKGSWLSKILEMAGADVTGYALPPQSNPNLFELLHLNINSVFGDIRDLKSLKKAFDAAQPEIVFHLAAQPLVCDGYSNPAYTYETNVMGTVNILECVRLSNCVRSFLNVTTDKVYKNNEWLRGYREDDFLDGFDPYSNSKSCSELVTHSYKNSFFDSGKTAISTARAGNVIGGGDFAVGRIIPNCVRAAERGEKIIIHNPHSVRPYQHVLESLFAYLMIAQRQYENIEFAGYYNVGPNECDCIENARLVQMFCDKWGDLSWESSPEAREFRESKTLRLDCSKLKSTFGWQPRWSVETAVEKTVEWTKAYFNGEDIIPVTEKQILEFAPNFK
jgi:CDP-glucose 4,6-dehydratase